MAADVREDALCLLHGVVHPTGQTVGQLAQLGGEADMTVALGRVFLV